jgi:hypothetical protein
MNVTRHCCLLGTNAHGTDYLPTYERKYIPDFLLICFWGHTHIHTFLSLRRDIDLVRRDDVDDVASDVVGRKGGCSSVLTVDLDLFYSRQG